MSTNILDQLELEAAETVRAILDKPMPASRGDIGGVDTFDPWDILDSLYGSYDEQFDDCAIDVLQDVLDGERRRRDLAADMIREMLCTAGLCDYGTSPRGCFPTEHFRELLPELIAKWRAWSAVAWSKSTRHQGTQSEQR